MTSDAAKRATAKYQREKMESISIRVKRSEGLYDRIKQAAAARGVKPAQFIKQALLTAAINGPQPAQTAQPQPYTTTTTGSDNLLQIPLSPDMVHNMDGAIRCGYSSDRVQYTIRAINTQLKLDIATEKEKRRPRPVYPPDDYFDDE